MSVTIEKLALAVLTIAALSGCSAPVIDATPTPSASESAFVALESGFEVPDVVGLDGWTAREVLEDAGFTVEATWKGEESFTDSALVVAATDPEAGWRDVWGALVTLELEVPPLPSHSVRYDGEVYRITVSALPTEQEMRWMVWEVMHDEYVDGGYFLQINCATGGTDLVDNRLANATWSIGPLGEAQTGISDGHGEVTFVEGATCP